MGNNKKVAITGLIGSGKSAVLSYLNSLNYPVISCDNINKELLNNSEYLDGLKKLFPYVFDNDKLQKNHLKTIISNNEDERKKLNNYAHKKIMNEVISFMLKHENTNVFVEVPLLSEVEEYINYFDEIWIVTADKNILLDRISKRDNIDIELANKILSTQTNEKKYSIPTFTIINNSNIELLHQQIDKYLYK
ncbi:MAG: dephospho-CoA kinase [Clostridia bacterium]|nr:dephospho-CoA kinase [Clostridia bacterium]